MCLSVFFFFPVLFFFSVIYLSISDQMINEISIPVNFLLLSLMLLLLLLFCAYTSLTNYWANWTFPTAASLHQKDSDTSGDSSKSSHIQLCTIITKHTGTLTDLGANWDQFLQLFFQIKMTHHCCSIFTFLLCYMHERRGWEDLNSTWGWTRVSSSGALWLSTGPPG